MLKTQKATFFYDPVLTQPEKKNGTIPTIKAPPMNPSSKKKVY